MRIRLVIPAALLVAAAYAQARRGATPPRRVATRTRAHDLPDEARVRAEAEAADAFELTGERAAAPPPPAPPAPLARPVRPAPPVRPASPALSWVDAPVTDPPPPGEPAAAESEVAATLAPAPPHPAPPPAGGWEAPEFPFAAARLERTSPRRVARPDGPDLASLAEWWALPCGAAPSEPSAAGRPHPATLSEWATQVGAATVLVAPPAPTGEVRIDAEGRFSLGGWAAQAGDMVLCGVTFRDRLDRPVAATDIRLSPDALANVAEGGLLVLGDSGFAPDGEGFTLVVSAAGPGAFAATGRYEVRAD